MLEAIDARRAHDRLPDVRVLGGRDRRRVRRAARGPRRRRACASACCSTPGARSRSTATLVDLMEAAGVQRPLVPAAPPAAARAGQPPHAPQGDDRRRGRRASPVASASPTSGAATPATSTSGATPTSASAGPPSTGSASAFLDNWAETDPELFDERRRPLPRPAPAPARRVVQCVRGASETGLERRRHAVPHAAAARPSERIRITTAYFVPDDELIDRLVRRRRARAWRSRSCCPVRTPTSGSCRSRAKRPTTALLERGVEIWNFQPSMLHAKVMTVDGVVVEHRLGEPQRPVDGAATRRSTSSCIDRELVAIARPPLRRGPRAAASRSNRGAGRTGP